MVARSTSKLALPVGLSAALAIASAPWALDWQILLLVFKPLTTVLIFVYAWHRGIYQPAARRWVLVGLLCSLVGDIVLMWPQGFLPGLVSFLLAHWAYLMAFTRERSLAARIWPFVAYGLLVAGVMAVLWPSIGTGLRGPVIVYVLFLGAMASQAAVLWSLGMQRGGVLALGGALFLCSDTLLAFNKFAGPLPYSQLAVLGTYWLAQWCIATWLAPRRLD